MLSFEEEIKLPCIAETGHSLTNERFASFLSFIIYSFFIFIYLLDFSVSLL
jgi:hypothetical protein